MLPSRPTTCGLIISCHQGWLLGHTTNTPFWDLPKGQMEPGEELLDAALRECREETGLDLSTHRDRCVYRGTEVYNRKFGKRLALFSLALPVPLDLSACRCTSLVSTRGPEPVLDMDDFAFVSPAHLERYLKPRMFRHLLQRGLLSSV